jgi:hypothetical protein
VGSPNAHDDQFTGYNPIDNQWHHVAAFFDGSRQLVRMYSDADLKGSYSTGYSQMRALDLSLPIGYTANGIMDEIKVYSRALSYSEIMADYLGACVVRFNALSATKFKFTSPVFQLAAANTSGLIIVEARDDSNGLATGFNETVTLLTSSNSGSFSVYSSPWSNTTVITFSSGMGTFYYRDNNVGQATITAYRASIRADTQVDTITPFAMSITSSTFSIPVNQVSPGIRVTAWDALSNTASAWAETAILSSSSTTGRFSLSDVSWVDTTTVKFASGSVIFYYRDTAAGTPVLSITRPDLGLYASQQDTITSVGGAAAYLDFVTNSFDTFAGQVSPYIKIAAKDAGGNTDTAYNETVTLSSSSNTYSFSVTYPTWSNTTIITLSSGVAIFYYTDTQAGQPVITAYRASLTTDTQTETIRPASLKFSSLPFAISSISTATVIARYRNADGNTATAWIPDTAVALTSSLKGKFSILQSPWANTTTIQFSSGVATFYYIDRLGGNPVITVTRTDYSYSDTQSDTVTRPIVTVSKIQYNTRSGNTGSLPIAMSPNDTIEYTIYITNTGTETAAGSILTDTRAFDTYTNNPVEYIWMETSTVASTWSYSLDTPTLTWTTGSPSYANIYIKGLKWKIDSLGIGQTKAIRFRVRIR